MATDSIPAILLALRDAVNAGDTDAFLAFFPSTGSVEDWGRRFSGHPAIRGWSDKELIGAQGTMTFGPVIERSPERISLQVDWISTFFTGPGIFTFVLADGKIAEMKISGA
ncbi:hypothetical protein [uncultured Devosia sp.]|uniref:hypothetical protein n=1 Tax=uncultured Devosia sp. TaxID=211434 RepID=UPI0035CA839F